MGNLFAADTLPNALIAGETAKPPGLAICLSGWGVHLLPAEKAVVRCRVYNCHYPVF